VSWHWDESSDVEDECEQLDGLERYRGKNFRVGSGVLERWQGCMGDDGGWTGQRWSDENLILTRSGPVETE
jgi:hypothetical protein